MSGLILSIITNVILGVLFLSVYGPRIISYIRNKKNLREIQANKERKEEIRAIVVEYLEEIKNA